MALRAAEGRLGGGGPGMNLLYGTTAGYCEQTAVSMRSVFANNQQAGSIDVYLLCENVPGALRDKMCSVAEGYPNAHVHCMDPAPLLEPMKREFRMGAWRGSFCQYIYACLCDAFPQLDRILWLDGDVVCVGSLRELWDMDMAGCCLTGSLDCTPFLALKVDDAFFRTPYYFNAGVLLFDLPNCREYGLQPRCRQVLRSYGDRLLYRDQTMLNLALPPERVRRVGLRWDWPAGLQLEVLRGLSRRSSPEKPTFTEAELNAELADVRLLHYIGGPTPFKPWFAEYRSPWKAAYLRYRAQTPWAQQPLRRWQDGSAAHAAQALFSMPRDSGLMGALAAAYGRLHGMQGNPNVGRAHAAGTPAEKS